MGISFSEVYFNISSLFNVLRYNFLEFKELSDIMLFTKDEEFYKEDILYVGYLSNVININVTNIHFLLIDDIGDYDYNNINLKNYIILKDEDLFSVFNRVKAYFTSNMYIINSSSILLNSLIQGKDLDYILNISENLITNPIILLDIGYKIIYSSQKYDIEEFWKINIEKGHCSYEVISNIKKFDDMKKAPNSSEPFMVNCPLSKKMVSKVFIKNTFIGYIIVFETNSKFTLEHFSLLKLISNITSEALQKNVLYKNMKGVDYENLLLDLLEENITCKEVLEQRMKSIEFKIDRKQVLIVIDFENYEGEINGFLQYSLEKIFKKPKSVYYKEKIIVLTSASENDYLEENTICKFLEFIKKENLYVGVSTSFEDLINIREHYEQALTALNLGKLLNMDKSIFDYESIKFYDFLSKTNNKHELSRFCHSALIKLKQYDKDNNTDYYDTLYYYIKYNFNANKTADKLYIHRNTMGYRINKIEKITNIDLKDGDTLFHINFSYNIMKFIEGNGEKIEVI